MPFDPAPQVEAPVRTGRFQHIADAMLKGCRLTSPCTMPLEFGGPNLNAARTCAWGAIRVGLYGLNAARWGRLEEEDALRDAYGARYHASYVEDFVAGRFTREQIAARIAAL